MSRNVDDIIGKLMPRQRKKVEARAAQLIAEEMTLRQLRQACRLATESREIAALGPGAGGLSRIRTCLRPIAKPGLS